MDANGHHIYNPSGVWHINIENHFEDISHIIIHPMSRSDMSTATTEEYIEMLSAGCEPLDDEEFGDKQIENVVAPRYDICDDCGGQMFNSLSNGNILQCSRCGAMKDDTEEGEPEYTPSSCSNNTYCVITGFPGSARSQHALYPAASPQDRRNKRIKTATQRLSILNNTALPSDRFPLEYIAEAAVMMADIQDRKSQSTDKVTQLRGPVYTSTLVRCLGIVCELHGYTPPNPSVLCRFGKISQTDLTKQSKTINDMQACGVIPLIQYHDPSRDMLRQIMFHFKIDPKYVDFGMKICVATRPGKMKGDNSSKTTSKIPAIVSILSLKLKLGITDAKILQYSGIVCMTYKRFCEFCVINRHALHAIFDAFGVARLTKHDYNHAGVRRGKHGKRGSRTTKNKRCRSVSTAKPDGKPNTTTHRSHGASSVDLDPCATAQ